MTDNELLFVMSDLLDAKLKAELQPIRDDIHVLKGEMQEVKSDIRLLERNVQTMKNDLYQVKLYQENILGPRLNTIEACYTSTYDLYKRNVERMKEVLRSVLLGRNVRQT